MITCTTLAEFLAVEADYYGAPNEERFEEAELDEWVEIATDGVPLDELEPLTAVAARTVTIDHAAVGDDLAERALDSALEYLDENWGDQDPFGDERADASGPAKALLRFTMRRVAKQYDVRRVVEVARYTLTVDDMRAILEDQ